MDLKNIMFKKEAQIGFITLNRPEVYNALNHAVWVELEEVIREIKKDSEIRVLILTGAGEKAFVSGADINDLSAMNIISGWENARYYQSILDQLDWLRKPSIAAINGYCFGGGLELAMACTLRIASEKARLGLPELGFGIVPGVGGTQRLMRLVGRGKAAEMILTAKAIDAQEAFRIGLVNEVAPTGELMPKAREMAESILKNTSTAVRLAMDLISRGPDMSLDNSLAFEAGLSAISFVAPETAERLKAFLEKKR
jgi:enoyl-CoA hydratase